MKNCLMIVTMLFSPVAGYAAYLPSDEFIAQMKVMLEKNGETLEAAKAEAISYRYVQTDKTHRPGAVAYFSISSKPEVFWMLEETEAMADGNLRMVSWKFTPDKVLRWETVINTDGRLISGGPGIQNQKDVDITSEVVEKSELTQELLKLAGKRTEI